jgi:large subunit ribosomal protein L4e
LSTRGFVGVCGADAKKPAQIALPAVFRAPIRLDVVQQVFVGISKNHRQPYAVAKTSGEQTSAESWGTGRAVARIPRVSGGGTHRAGQGAFGNMCRGGRMFAPTRVWRKWNRKVNINQKRFAIASALAASAVAPLVMARGHRVEGVPEVPLVLADSLFKGVTKTAAAVALLKKFSAYADVERVKHTRKVRAGRGKLRNRRHVQRRGPLVVYDAKNAEAARAFRNISGVETTTVQALNLLQLAPGGHIGRFIIWTAGAFQQLEKLYGAGPGKLSALKKDYSLPSAKMTNPDLARIINSDEVQSKLRAARPKNQRRAAQKKNPLKNLGTLIKLNPHAKTARRNAVLASERAAKRRTHTTRRRASACAPDRAAIAHDALRRRSAVFCALPHVASFLGRFRRFRCVHGAFTRSEVFRGTSD